MTKKLMANPVMRGLDSLIDTVDEMKSTTKGFFGVVLFIWTYITIHGPDSIDTAITFLDHPTMFSIFVLTLLISLIQLSGTWLFEWAPRLIFIIVGMGILVYYIITGEIKIGTIKQAIKEVIKDKEDSTE